MLPVRFDITRDFDDLRREVNRVFTGVPTFMTPLQDDLIHRWIPAMDTVQEEGTLHLTMDLPGLSEQDIDIELVDDVLTISGSREIKREQQTQQWHRYERAAGEFVRAVQLPSGVDSESIKAVFHEGVLQVTIPTPEEVGTRSNHIEITSGSPTT